MMIKNEELIKKHMNETELTTYISYLQAIIDEQQEVINALDCSVECLKDYTNAQNRLFICNSERCDTVNRFDNFMDKMITKYAPEVKKTVYDKQVLTKKDLCTHPVEDGIEIMDLNKE